MEAVPIVVKFDGDLAAENRLPAYEGSESLRGVTRSMVIPINYLIEGRVRRKQFQFHDYDLRLVATRPGSFEFVYELVANPAVWAAIATYFGLAAAEGAKAFVTEFTKSILNRATGQGSDDEIDKQEAAGKLKSGDVEALVDAVEPPLRLGHTVINSGAQRITIIQGNGNNIYLNKETKDYVNGTVEDPLIRTRLFSISGYNADSRNGRAFDLDEFRTIPFHVDSDADADTVNAIASSMRHYALRRFGNDTGSAIAVQYRGYLSPDGRLKKVRVFRARSDIQSLMQPSNPAA